MSKQKRNIRVSVNEDEYGLVREILHKTKGVGRPAKLTELDTLLGEWTNEFPDGDEQVSNHVKVEGKTAILSDIHIGVHDKDALMTALRYLKKEKIETIVLNGDIIDSAALSTHVRNIKPATYLYEVDLAKGFLSNLRTEFPQARILFKEGNHEDRLNRWIHTYASHFEGIVNLKSLLELSKKEIEFVESSQIIKHTGTWIVHGHEMKVSGGVNPARALLLKAFANTIMGHVHKTSASHGRNLNGDFIRAWTTGCLCKLQQAYMPHSHSNHGFAIINEDGEVRNMWVIGSKVEG